MGNEAAVKAKKEKSLKKIELAWKKLKKSGMYPSLSEFARIAGISRGVITNTFPEWAEKIKKHNQKGDLRDIPTKLHDAWEQVIANEEYPTLSEFAKSVGIATGTLRKSYPEFHKRVADRYISGGVDTRIEKTLKRIQDAWGKLEVDNEYPNVFEFAHLVGLSETGFRKTYPDWVEKVKERYRIKNPEGITKIMETWNVIVGKDLYPSVRQFGMMAGISDSVIHKNHPDWAKKITERYKKGDLRDTSTKIQETWDNIVENGLYPSVSEFSRMAGVNISNIYRSYREWAEKILERRSVVEVSALQKIEETWDKVNRENEYPNVKEFAELAGVSTAHIYDYYNDWAIKINKRHQNKPFKTFMRKNQKGSILYVLKTGGWQIVYFRNEKEKKVNVYWDGIPSEWVEFWQDIARSFFDKDDIFNVSAGVKAAKKLHAWLNLPTIDFKTGEIIEEKKVLTNFDELSEIDYGIFEEALRTIPLGGGKQALENDGGRSMILADLATAFKEAYLELERPEVSMLSVVRIRDVKNGIFRNISKLQYQNNAQKVLQVKELEKVFEALINEFDECQKVDNELDRIKKFPDSRANMLAVVCIWLGLRHGIRSEEFLNLRLHDIKRDEEFGHHKLHCKGTGNKPERYIQIDNNTLNILDFYIHWSDSARREIGKDFFAVCYIRIRAGVYEAKAADSTTIKHALISFKNRQGLSEELKLDGKNLRRTFGSNIAKMTDNREITRQVLGHSYVSTTEMFYTAINRADLSHEISNALRVYALQIAMSYKNVVYELEVERPETYRALEENPERDLKLGVCDVPKKTESLKDSCVRAPSCVECDFLIVEARKLPNYIIEKEKCLDLAEKARSERVKQQRLRRVQVLDAYIFRIENAISERQKIEQKQGRSNNPRRRTTYKRK